MSGFTIDPSYPFAATVNKEIALSQSLSKQQLYNQMRVAYPGDPLVGTLIPNTTIPWEESTETQSLIYEWYLESGTALPADFQSTLLNNAGPNEPWNGSYAYWGLVPGIDPNPSLGVVDVIDLATAKRVRGFPAN